VTYSFSEHPAGVAGAALLLLRVAAASCIASVCYLAIQGAHSRWMVVALALFIVLLLLGLGTRVVALAGAAITGGIGLTQHDWSSALIAIHAINMIAICLLGAGAYSIDAYLFGRRVIHFDS
jgi:hypothetical protein